ncbi:MAG: AAA family ATPase [Caulobacter sp.]|nr:AAA family ATPase [Caulobacter sp.]
MIDTPTKTFTREEIDALRAAMEAYRNETTPPRTWSRMGELSGVNDKSLAAWVPGTYDKGEYWKNQDIPAKVERFLVSLQERASLAATVPATPGFQRTLTATRMMNVFSYASGFGGIAAIATAPGCGKTMTARNFQKTRANVFMTTVSRGCGGPVDVLAGLLESMGEPGQKGMISYLKRRIVERLTGIEGLLIIDEAQYGTPSALEELRAIHDQTGCGVVLVGDDKLPGVLKGFAQLHSRIIVSHIQKVPEPDDVEALAAAWEISDEACLAFLKSAATKAGVGGLRRITHAIRLGVMAAQAEDRPLVVQDLKDGLTQRFMEGL